MKIHIFGHSSQVFTNKHNTHLQVRSERIREAHVSRERTQDQIPHLDAVGRNYVTE